MAKEFFVDWNPNKATLVTLAQANEIIEAYRRQGYSLSLRQLYYQLVSRDIIPNKQAEYKRLGEIIRKGRDAGIVDWAAIEDRGRSVVRNSHWESPADILHSAAQSFAIDKWKDQKYRPFVLVEKDALSGVIEPVCRRHDIAFTANKGYASASHVYRIAKSAAAWNEAGQTPVFFYLGDHDPSGLDMDRDIFDRVELYSGLWGGGALFTLERLALTMPQVEEYGPPPNPAKLTDARADGYVAEFGYSSWELDALEPSVLAGLIESAVLKVRDEALWHDALDREAKMRDFLYEEVDTARVRFEEGEND